MVACEISADYFCFHRKRLYRWDENIKIDLKETER
jgi:hypothetical protein